MKQYNIDRSMFDDVIDNGLNIKMKNLTGCDIPEGWTLDDCESSCEKYYSCYAVALANDVLTEYEETNRVKLLH